MLRSLLRTCRQAAQGLTLSAGVEPAPVVLFRFDSPAVAERWHVFTDAFWGGKSRAAFAFNEQEQAAEFAGRVTLEQEPDADLRRAGYAVAASKVTAIGDYWDLSGCSALALEVAGDGRTYIANVRVDSIAGTGGDVWQAPFRTLPGHRWTRVVIPIASLALTYQGQVVQQRLEFQADKVIGVGVAVSVLETSSSSSSGEAEPVVPAAALTQAASEAAASSSSSSSAAGAAPPTSAGGSSSNDGSTAPAAAGAADPPAPPPPDDVPEHERFRLLIRSIRAEVEADE